MCHEIIRPEGTTKTASLVFRPKHEMVHNELFVEVGEFNGTRGASKDVAFGDLHRGKIAGLRVHGIVGADGGFSLDERALRAMSHSGGETTSTRKGYQ
jgi:hypothetical protein